MPAWFQLYFDRPGPIFLSKLRRWWLKSFRSSGCNAKTIWLYSFHIFSVKAHV